MNRRGEEVSPHKVCMLLAVMDLVKEEELVNNRIHFNDNLKRAFTIHFKLLGRERDRNTPYLPFYHLNSSDFWHHKIREGKQTDYDKLTDSNSENKTCEAIEYVYVDPELFEHFKSINAREALTAALGDNFSDEIRDSFLVPPLGWSWMECEAIVKDYFEMLEQELRGDKYNKSEHNRKLQESLNNRTKGSVERKHQNISAVLKEMGMPIIDGYKPLSKYQRNILPDVVGAELAKSTVVENLIENINQNQRYEIPSVNNILDCLVEKPKTDVDGIDEKADYDPGKYKLKKVNYLEREARNQKLGLAGEQFVVNYEKARLIYENKVSLSEQITHVSLEDDSLGYDIHSYDKNGSDRFIEVKTTNFARHTHFYVTKNEVNTSQKLEEQYHLYRVFNFCKDPRFYRCRGDLAKNLTLNPIIYSATI